MAAWAGPPYITDDPEPTEHKHWEIYAFAAATRAHGAIEGGTGVDLNYGAAPGVQLTATLPAEFANEGGLHAGPGNVEIGVKYRFWSWKAAGVEVAAFPRLILPTGGRRFGRAKTALLLPLWGQKDVGPWSLFGGGGYLINPGSGNRDAWQSGLALTRTMSERLSIGVEVAHAGADAVDAGSTTDVGLGGVYKLNGPFALLVSAGPEWEHRHGTAGRAYIALAAVF